jgi:phage gp45-like
MTVLQSINEGSTAYLTASFEDEDGVAVVPDSITYRIDCLTSGTVIRNNTSVTPATSIEIKLTPGDNVIVNPGTYCVSELRLVTVEAVLGDNDVITEEYKYAVKSLLKVSRI